MAYARSFRLSTLKTWKMKLFWHFCVFCIKFGSPSAPSERESGTTLRMKEFKLENLEHQKKTKNEERKRITKIVRRSILNFNIVDEMVFSLLSSHRCTIISLAVLRKEIVDEIQHRRAKTKKRESIRKYEESFLKEENFVCLFPLLLCLIWNT